MSLGVGIIGCGAIGTVLAQAIDNRQAGDVCLVMIYDKTAEKAKALSNKLKNKPKIAENPEELIECRDIGLVIEAASQEAVASFAVKTLKAGKDLLIMSAGALVDSKLENELRCVARENSRKVYVPSGAVAGLDGIRSSAIGGLKSVILTTRKPLEGLKESKYFMEKYGNKRIEKPTVIYEGPAYEACRLFPANVNVAATVGLAGIGAEKTIVKIIADPRVKRNIHDVEVKGKFGELKVHVENVPFTDNPKTSYLAALSAIATLKKITDSLIIGT